MFFNFWHIVSLITVSYKSLQIFSISWNISICISKFWVFFSCCIFTLSNISLLSFIFEDKCDKISLGWNQVVSRTFFLRYSLGESMSYIFFWVCVAFPHTQLWKCLIFLCVCFTIMPPFYMSRSVDGYKHTHMCVFVTVRGQLLVDRTPFCW